MTPASTRSRKQRLQVAILSLSLANLCFLFMWKEILGMAGDTWVRFTADYVPRSFPVWALAIDITCLAGIIFGLVVLREGDFRFFSRTAGILFALVCAIAIYEPAAILAGTLKGHRLRFRMFLSGEILAGVLLLALLIRYPKPSLKLLRTACLILFPIFPVLLVSGLLQYHQAQTQWAGNGKARGMLPAQKVHNRVIWVIFDELDRRIAFDFRPQRIQLSEFDRLRSESLDANRVQSPAMNTAVSIPSLLLGDKKISCVRATAAGELMLRIRDSTEFTAFNSQSHIFKKVREAGFNAGVTGWLFPYCRWVGNTVSDCGWGICGLELGSVYKALEHRPFYRQAWYLAKWEVEALPFVAGWVSPKPEVGGIYRNLNINTLKVVLDDALRMLTNPDLNLVFLHLPIPHPPAFGISKRMLSQLANPIT